MDFAPGWPRVGGGPCCPAGERRDASVSLSRCRRSTEAPDGIGALPAGPPARARVRHSPLPRSWQAPPSRAPGPDLDGQSYGPPADGTDRSEVPVIGGGPQSSAATAARNLAAGSPVTTTRLRSRHSGPPRRLCCRLRRTAVAVGRLGRCRSHSRMSGGAAVETAPVGRGTDPRLSGGRLAAPSAQLSLYPFLFPIRARGGKPSWRPPGKLAGCPPADSLPPVPSRWLRSRSLIP